MGNRLREWRDRRGKSLEDIAYAIGISPGYLSRLETGGRNVSLKYLPALARELGTRESDLVGGQHRPKSIPVMGYVGAGSEAHFYSDAHALNEWVEAPDSATERTCAVQIRGNSLGALFDGWFAYYDDVKDPPGDSLVGRMCICGLADGRVLIKALKRSQAAGLWTLLSNTEAPIYDQEVNWAAEVVEMRFTASFTLPEPEPREHEEKPPAKKRLQKPVSHIGKPRKKS